MRLHLKRVDVNFTWTSIGSDFKIFDCNAFSIDTEFPFITFCSFWSQAWVNVIDAEINQGCSARNDPSAGIDERVRQDCHGLHAELEPLV